MTRQRYDVFCFVGDSEPVLTHSLTHVGADLCPTLGRRAGDLCLGLGVPPVLGVRTGEVAPPWCSGVLPPEKMDILHKKSCIFVHYVHAISRYSNFNA